MHWTKLYTLQSLNGREMRELQMNFLSFIHSCSTAEWRATETMLITDNAGWITHSAGLGASTQNIDNAKAFLPRSTRYFILIFFSFLFSRKQNFPLLIIYFISDQISKCNRTFNSFNMELICTSVFAIWSF